MTQKTEAQKEKERHEGATLAVFALPIAAFTALPIVAGWFAARFYMPYRIVKGVVFPAGFVVSNVLMVMPLLTILFFASFHVRGAGGLGEMFLDMTMWESIFLPSILGFWSIFFGTGVAHPGTFSPNGTPVLAIFGYQVAIWWFIGRHVNKQIAMALYDAATVKIAQQNDMNLLAARRRRAQLDKGYLAETLIFQKKNSYAFLSPIAVSFAGGDFNEMYGL